MRAGERDFLRRLLTTAAIIALVVLAWQLADILLLVLGAVLLAIVFRSIAAPLCRWLHVPAQVGLALAVLIMLSVIGLGAWLFGAEIRAQTSHLLDAVPDAWRAIERRIAETTIGDQVEGMLAEAGAQSSVILAGAGRILVSLGSAVAAFVLVFAGGIYIAADPELYRRGLLKLFPASQRERVGTAIEDSGRALRRWLLGQLLSMVVIGVLTGIGLALVGLPSALALGLLAGLAAFVPVIGAIAAGIPALLTATAQGGTVVLLTLGVYLLVQQVEENIVMPLVQRRAVALPPALLLFAILAFGVLFGIPGMLLAAPLTVVVFVLVKRLYVREALDTDTPIPGERE
jgi:predicted PurR-regulated permease PerM